MGGEKVAARASRATGESTFFAIMALFVAAVVIAGFGPTYTASLAPPGLPLWVHLHGAVMTAWILLFVAQAWLIRRRSLTLHRSLGFASIGLVLTMVPLGVATTLLCIRRDAVPPFFTPNEVFAADLCNVLLFVTLYGWAVAWRRRRDWHKRLMLSATILLSWPAIGRLHPLWHFGVSMIIPLSIAVLLGMALIGPTHDLVTRRRIHPAYIWGVALTVLLYPLYTMLKTTAPIQSIVASVLPRPA